MQRPKCQHENPEGARFCNACGAKLEPTCPACDHRNPPGSRFCNAFRSTRQQIHRQIAQVLESRFPETAEVQPELLAHHYTEAGLHVLAEVLARIDEIGIRQFAAEVYRTQGDLLLQLDIPDEQRAETCFHQALDIARHQRAKSLELRAAMSLARLWQSQGKRQAARDLLAPVYGWFTEGFDTVDLIEAKRLLQELA